MTNTMINFNGKDYTLIDDSYFVGTQDDYYYTAMAICKDDLSILISIDEYRRKDEYRRNQEDI